MILLGEPQSSQTQEQECRRAFRHWDLSPPLSSLLSSPSMIAIKVEILVIMVDHAETVHLHFQTSHFSLLSDALTAH